MATVTLPTWADHYTTLGTGTSKEFTVREGTTSNIIYTGTIYSKSGSSETLKVNVAPIIRDYIFAEYCVPNQNTGLLQSRNEKTKRTFWVYQGSTQKDTLIYYMDWTLYSLTDTLSTRLRNDPIIPRFSPVQGLFVTTFDSSMTIAIYLDDDGSQDPSKKRTMSSSGITTQWIGDGQDLGGTKYWHNYNWIDVVQPTPDGRYMHLDIVQECRRWCLDYLNAWGGWDSLLIEGKWREIDAYARGQYRTGDGLIDANNVYKRNIRDNTDYLNTITRRFELNTALLTEDEASRMHHLLGSTDVYLRDLYLAEEYPSWAVNIVNTECEYKKNDAGVWGAQYTITVEFSQQITRQ